MANMKYFLDQILEKNSLNLSYIRNIKHLKIKKSPNADLHINYLGKVLNYERFSFEHRFKDGGDLKYDPKMEFIYYNNEFLADTYQLDILKIFYKGIRFDKDGKILTIPKIYEELERSADEWATILISQGFIKGKLIRKRNGKPVYKKLLYVIKLLKEEDRTYAELKKIFSVSKMTIHKYLKSLIDFGISEERQKERGGKFKVWTLKEDWKVGFKEFLKVYPISEEELQQLGLDVFKGVN